MTIERHLTIEKIKTDIAGNGKPFFKLFFKEKKGIYPNKENNLQEERSKVYFVWPGNQSYQMLKENQFKEGDKVQCRVKEKDNYLSIETIELDKPQEQLQG